MPRSWSLGVAVGECMFIPYGGMSNMKSRRWWWQRKGRGDGEGPPRGAWGLPGTEVGLRNIQGPRSKAAQAPVNRNPSKAQHGCLCIRAVRSGVEVESQVNKYLVFSEENPRLPQSVHFFSSVTQSCLTLCDPMNRSMPGLPVHHQLSEFIQTHAYWVGDAIQPSHLLSSPSPPAPNPSQHQGLFQWVSSLHEVAKVLEFQLQHQTF